MQNKSLTKLYFLGGLEEVGKNCYCVEHEDEIIMIDCGIKMPGMENYGFDHIIPDFSYVTKRKEKFKSLIITHGHEDHIGAIPYLLKELDFLKIYAPKIAVELISRKLRDFSIEPNKYKIFEVNDDWSLKTKHFFIEPYNMVHSIPDTYGYFITSPNGVISTTADYRFDFTPLGPITNFNKISQYSSKKCTLLVADSTNSLVPGFSRSETEVVQNIDTVFSKCKGRLIVSAFSSNIYRLQEIVKKAIKFKRKILIYGRSMERNLQASLKLNYINIDNINDLFIKSSQTKNLMSHEILILCTGSQGEPLSSLQKMSNGKHPSIKIVRGDSILFSSKPIPGNFLAVEIMVNKLSRLGAKVIQTNNNLPLHTSGHANQNEQKLMFALLKPKYFMPMHGEYNMLVEHSKTAAKMGIPFDNSFVCKNGDVVALDNGRAFLNGEIESGVTYIDGSNKVDLNNDLIKTRNSLLNNGMISVIYTVDKAGKSLLYSPVIISRGTFYVKENAKLIYQLQGSIAAKVNEILNKANYMQSKSSTEVTINNSIIRLTSDFIYKRKKRIPLVSPICLLEN